MNAPKERQRQQVEANLGRAQPWVKRLWQEDHAERRWGFAVFRDPKFDDRLVDDYEARKDVALWWARDAVGCQDVIGGQWRLQYLDWPDQDGAAKGDEKNEERKRTAEGAHSDGVPLANDPELALLRKHFRASITKLGNGILQNTFLLITQPCINSALSNPSSSVDDMWVWAIDPEYEPSELDPEGYPGYLRVRLQQLVNNFFGARRFHEDDVSMQQLWESAQRSRNQIFVSMNDDEVGLWTYSRDVGSALRPPGWRKIITDLDDL